MELLSCPVTSPASSPGWPLYSRTPKCPQKTLTVDLRSLSPFTMWGQVNCAAHLDTTLEKDKVGKKKKVGERKRILRDCVIVLNHLSKGTFFFFFCLFTLPRAAPTTYGGSQGRGLIRAVATSLQQSHSNAGSKLRL